MADHLGNVIEWNFYPRAMTEDCSKPSELHFCQKEYIKGVIINCRTTEVNSHVIYASCSDSSFCNLAEESETQKMRDLPTGSLDVIEVVTAAPKLTAEWLKDNHVLKSQMPEGLPMTQNNTIADSGKVFVMGTAELIQPYMFYYEPIYRMRVSHKAGSHQL